MTEMEWRRAFSDRLSYMMYRNNITRQGLVRASGISESAISYYLSGTKTPGFKSIINLAYALCCTMDDLIDFGEDIE